MAQDAAGFFGSRDHVPVSILTSSRASGLRLLQVVTLWTTAWDAVRRNPDAPKDDIVTKIKSSTKVKAFEWAVILPLVIQIVQTILSFFAKKRAASND